jgi:beta-glucosidase
MKRIFLLVFALIPFAGYSQNEPYKNPALPVETRVNDLVSRMTTGEKISQLLFNAPAIDRLGIPEYNWWNEALHGVARAGYATVFPQSITIADSWDEELMLSVASAISDEARAKYHEALRRGEHGLYQGLTFWSPNINIFRDPRWGRGHETYGEDPFLTGRMGMQFVRGMQGSDKKYLKTIATAKHFAVHSGPEPTRHNFDAQVSERDLQETYLSAFRMLVTEGHVCSVMGAYNQLRGVPCCVNNDLFSILRNKWGFSGYFVTDCWALSDIHDFQNYAPGPAETAALAIKAGTDLECGVDFSHLAEALDKGLVSVSDIDRAAKRVMTARFRLGMFDPDSLVEYSQIPYSANCSDYNRSLARKAAQESVVLLKNENNTLPLNRNIKSIAVIGPDADNWEALIGNYNGIPKCPVTVLDGIRKKADPLIKVNYAEGADLAPGIHNLHVIPSCYLMTEEGKQGVSGQYFNNKEMNGAPVFTRTDDKIDFYWDNNSPSPEMPVNDFGIHWTTYLVPPVSGKYILGAWGSSDYQMLFEGKELFKYHGEHHAYDQETPVDLKAGEKYKIEIFYRNWTGDADMRLLWAQPRENLLDDAVATASASDVVVLVLGLSQRLEGEEMTIKTDGFSGGDRTSLNLPANQEKLLEAILNTGKPVTVVLMNGGPVASMQAQERAGAVILAGYNGVEGGDAVADVLFGDYNPAGRLPVTYYKSTEQLPAFENYDMTGRTYRYFKGTPLYPFGYGLSYTTFAYSDLIMTGKASTGDSVRVSVIVTNTGKVSGDEVAELYLTDEKASTPRPARQLEGFKRVNLKAGETKRVDFVLSPRQFSLINNDGKRVIEPGWFTISVGGKQPGFEGYLDAKTTGVVSSRIKLTGKTVEQPE